VDVLRCFGGDSVVDVLHTSRSADADADMGCIKVFYGATSGTMKIRKADDGGLE
jgi:hypothetical protein